MARMTGSRNGHTHVEIRLDAQGRLFVGDPKVLTKKFRSAVTDSETEIRFDRETKPGSAVISRG